MVRMKDERLPKRSDTKKQEGCRKRGRPQLRWEDCKKRDLRMAEEEDMWREEASNTGAMGKIAKVAGVKTDQPHLYRQGKQDEALVCCSQR